MKALLISISQAMQNNFVSEIVDVTHCHIFATFLLFLRIEISRGQNCIFSIGN